MSMASFVDHVENLWNDESELIRRGLDVGKECAATQQKDLQMPD